jgi:hypothetical protein
MHPVEVIADLLQVVLKVGIRPARLAHALDLLDYLDHAVSHEKAGDPYRRSLILEAILTEAVQSLGDGPMGRAANALFGLTSDTKGRLLKDRRRLAAKELDLLPSTFRKYYELDLIRDVALELWRNRERTR